MRPQEHPLQLTLQEPSTELEGARPGPRAPPRTLHPPVPSARCLAVPCQCPSSRTISSTPELRSCVPPCCCLALQVALLTPEPQAWLGCLPSTASSPKVCFPSCAPVSLASTSKPCPFMCSHRGFLGSGAEPCHQLPICWGGGGRIWEADAAGQSLAWLPLPAPLPLGPAGGGPSALCRGLIFRAIHPLWRAGSCSAFACGTPCEPSMEVVSG